MLSAGEMLRQERLKRNRSISDIAGQTCISTQYLHAIEAGDLKHLPGDFFYRSFIKQYAQALELDDVQTRQIVDAAPRSGEVDPLPRLNLAYQIARTEGRSSGLYKTPTPVAMVLLVAVLAGSSAVYAWWHKAQVEREPGAEPVATHAVNSSLPETVQAASETETPTSETGTPVEPAPATSAPSPTPTPYVP